MGSIPIQGTMSNNNQTVTVGPGFMGCLGLLFIGLKLTGYIDWSWWLVLLPIYGPLIVILVILSIVLLLAILFQAGR